EDATPDERRALRSAVARRFALGGGIMTVTKDTGVFVASGTAGTGGLDLRARAGGTAAPGEGSGAGAAPPAERGTTPVAMTGEVP
ncbi:MAG TPA: hypothetical protein VFI47_11605, partial [Acidimicrobiales bacterium]|nr:hypothetical protein [Acidimicrobiales bacterium]